MGFIDEAIRKDIPAATIIAGCFSQVPAISLLPEVEAPAGVDCVQLRAYQDTLHLRSAWARR